MNKDVNVKVIFKGKSVLLQCTRRDFMNEVEKRLNVNSQLVELFYIGKKSKTKICPDDISTGMIIEILPKGATQRNLHSYYGGESSKKETFVERIIGKLDNNTMLTGQERKYIKDVLLEYSTTQSGKRKHVNETNGQTNCKMIHKMVQARPTIEFCKSSFTQTDISLESADASNSDTQNGIARMKRLAASAEQNQQNQEEIKVLMDNSFNDRRNFILLKAPLIALIRDNYPLLFSVTEIKNELERLFYVGKCEEFMNNIDKYSSIILNSCEKSSYFYQRTLRSMENCFTDKQKKYAKAVGSVLILPGLNDENIGFLNTSDNKGTSDIYPYIEASLHSMKAVFFDNMLFKIIAEKQLICEAHDFKEAILCLVASFFIFNIDYTEGCENTLTIFEKLYLCANDTHDLDPKTDQLIKIFTLKAAS